PKVVSPSNRSSQPSAASLALSALERAELPGWADRAAPVSRHNISKQRMAGHSEKERAGNAGRRRRGRGRPPATYAAGSPAAIVQATHLLVRSKFASLVPPSGTVKVKF